MSDPSRFLHSCPTISMSLCLRLSMPRLPPNHHYNTFHKHHDAIGCAHETFKTNQKLNAADCKIMDSQPGGSRSGMFYEAAKKEMTDRKASPAEMAKFEKDFRTSNREWSKNLEPGRGMFTPQSAAASQVAAIVRKREQDEMFEKMKKAQQMERMVI